jgi:creatinine amidohydrolase
VNIEQWQHLTSGDLGEVDPESTIALLLVAAIEQHGPHLPLGTDALIGQGIIGALPREADPNPRLLVLPSLVLGHSLEHRAFPGTLTLEAETLIATWVEIGRSVAEAGLRKLVIFNSHGGQTHLVDIVALRLRVQMDLLVARCSYFAFGTPPGLFAEDELSHGLHGGEVETSLMLHLHPSLVRREHLQDFEGLPAHMARRNELLGVESPVGIGWMSQDLNPAGVCGRAARADAERGAQLLHYLADRLATLIVELAETPLETLRSSR